METKFESLVYESDESCGSKSSKVNAVSFLFWIYRFVITLKTEVITFNLKISSHSPPFDALQSSRGRRKSSRVSVIKSESVPTRRSGRIQMRKHSADDDDKEKVKKYFDDLQQQPLGVKVSWIKLSVYLFWVANFDNQTFISTIFVVVVVFIESASQTKYCQTNDIGRPSWQNSRCNFEWWSA